MENIEVKTITPVHVGSGRFLMSKTEYVFSRENIGLINEAKVLPLIGEDRIAAWVSAIDQGTGLVEFLGAYGIRPTLQAISERTLQIRCDKTRAKNLTTLKEQIHNGQGLPYIPGSSIKGAVRSAVWNQLIRSRKTPVTDRLLLNRNERPTAAGLERELFGSDPNHDVFRFLRIGDAYFPGNSTIALIMDNLNLKDNPEDPDARTDTSKNQLVEAIGQNLTAETGMHIDTTGMMRNMEKGWIRHFPASFSDMGTLMQLINKNTIQLLEEEVEFWKEYEGDDAHEYVGKLENLLSKASACGPRECLLRLAHGSGWKFISGNWIRSEDLLPDYDLYGAIIDSTRPNNRKYEGYPFPKSRRISSNFDLPGFVRLAVKEK